MYRLFVQRGHHVQVVADPRWTGAGEAALVEGGVSVSKMEIRHRLDGKAVRALRHRFQAFAPDVVYAPLNRSLSASLMAAGQMRIPVIGYRGTTGHISRWDPASRLTYFHPRLAHIVCVSEAVRRYLLQVGIPDSMVTTIYKGHRVEWYDSGESVDMEVFGVPANAFTLGFIGNIRPVKGVDILLRSVDHLAESINAHVLLVGSAAECSREMMRLRRRPGIAGRVHFAGIQHDAFRFCRHFDVLVMPSVEREGLPRAVIEAMAQRVPPVVSDVGGMPELVEDGVCGLVVPPRDPRRLAEAITRLARSPELRRRFGDQARRRIREKFSIDQTADKTLALFAGLSRAACPRADAGPRCGC